MLVHLKAHSDTFSVIFVFFIFVNAKKETKRMGKLRKKKSYDWQAEKVGLEVNESKTEFYSNL